MILGAELLFGAAFIFFGIIGLAITIGMTIFYILKYGELFFRPDLRAWNKEHFGNEWV